MDVVEVVEEAVVVEAKESRKVGIRISVVTDTQLSSVLMVVFI